MARYGYGREDEGRGYYEERGRGGGAPWRWEGDRWQPEESWRDDWRAGGRDRERWHGDWRAGERDRERWLEERGRWGAENPGETWRGGAPTAEAGLPFGSSHFGRAYALYAGGGREGRFEGAGDPRAGAGHGRGAWERGMESPRRHPPRSYRRSDQAILDEIAERIVFGGIDAGEVEVKVENGEVTLTGTVADRRDKRRVEDACEDVLGVQDVHNRIRISRREADPRSVH